MIASKMGILRRTANWNLWYMNVDLDLDFGCSLLFLFYVYGWEKWHLSKFCVFNRFGYRARQTSAYVSTLHCDILSSCEQTPNWHLQHYRGSSKVDCRSNRISFLVSRWERELRFHTSLQMTILHTELSYLSCLLLFFETPELKMKWVLWESIGSCLRL